MPKKILGSGFAHISIPLVAKSANGSVLSIAAVTYGTVKSRILIMFRQLDALSTNDGKLTHWHKSVYAGTRLKLDRIYDLKERNEHIGLV